MCTTRSVQWLNSAAVHIPPLPMAVQPDCPVVFLQSLLCLAAVCQVCHSSYYIPNHRMCTWHSLCLHWVKLQNFLWPFSSGKSCDPHQCNLPLCGDMTIHLRKTVHFLLTYHVFTVRCGMHWYLISHCECCCRTSKDWDVCGLLKEISQSWLRYWMLWTTSQQLVNQTCTQHMYLWHFATTRLWGSMFCMFVMLSTCYLTVFSTFIHFVIVC
jgi:hypothetical protein